jgi:Domain of unknown function (DUF4864)
MVGAVDARVAARRAAGLLSVVLAFFTLVAPPALAAEKVTPADKSAIEKVIRDQLDAFTRDDAQRAFAHATPEIQRMFGTSDDFIRMVRDSYQPVYRSSAVEFVKLVRVDDEWVQAVQLVDDEGRVWRALFTMKRQPDKSWKVGGCQLVQTNAVAT